MLELQSMETLNEIIAPFIKSVADNPSDIYNEFSLQHELGIFLRNRFPDYKVQFERNVDFFFPGGKSRFSKREIDLTVFSPDRDELKWAIELKFPKNGQYPETMFGFCKDIAFVEELKSEGFSHTGVLILASDHLFYSGSTNGIYGFFRGGRTIHGPIQKPTGGRDVTFDIRGTYDVEWRDVVAPLKYATIESADFLLTN